MDSNNDAHAYAYGRMVPECVQWLCRLMKTSRSPFVCFSFVHLTLLHWERCFLTNPVTQYNVNYFPTVVALP
ncbi:uncharacterized protein ARMOST_14375 [Armillaria ostoyae]|uniref:Uncharacterized protein n=1 Tax=Armillaria ostoyae TaxID=47428 RepID=A0A284RQD2_ARMOS|nr:uncharacterized protein ARMOST_14375 [Armillaria ostoyae]